MCEINTVSSPANVLVYSRGSKQDSGKSEVYVLSPRSVSEVITAVRRIRATLAVKHATRGAEVQSVYQTTNDGDDWSKPVAFADFFSGDGAQTSSWADLNDVNARGIRFGVLVRQAKGSEAVEICRVTQVIDLEIK